MPSSMIPTFDLQIDGRQLFHPVYLSVSGSGKIIDPKNPAVTWGVKGVDTRLHIVTYSFGPDPNGVTNTDGSDTFRIGPPGIYQVWSADAVRSSVVFDFKPDGSFVLIGANGAPVTDSQVYYSIAPAAQGEPAKLTLSGYPIKIDARYPTGTGMIVCNNPTICLEAGSPNQAGYTFQGNFLPSQIGYSFEQGSGMNDVGFGFTVDQYGKVFYPTTYDINSGGPYSGLGSTTLEMLGIPLLIDARAVGPTATINVLNIPGPYDQAGNPAVALLCLMPLNEFVLSFGADDPPNVTPPTFAIGTSGQITVKNGTAFALALDKFHGLARITVSRRE